MKMVTSSKYLTEDSETFAHRCGLIRVFRIWYLVCFALHILVGAEGEFLIRGAVCKLIGLFAVHTCPLSHDS